MRIESGSQNASRIPGVFAYPVHHYSSSPIEAVGIVKGQNPRILELGGQELKSQTLQRLDRESHLPHLYAPEKSATVQSMAASGKRENPLAGKFIDKLA